MKVLFYVFLYFGTSAMLSPPGARVLSLQIHCLSRRFRRSWAFSGFRPINWTTEIDRCSTPLCSGLLKWAQTCLLCRRSKMCALKRSLMVFFVCPTYCLQHLVHVIQQMRFELWQDIFVLVGQVICLTDDVMVPLLSMSAQI